MLIRISLIVAIIAGLAAGVLNFVKVKEKITTLQKDLADTKADLATTKNTLNKTKQDLAKTQTELKQTQATLKTTTEERDAAVAEAKKQGDRATKLNDDLDQDESRAW